MTKLPTPSLCHCVKCDKQHPTSYLHKPIGILGKKSFEGVSIGLERDEKIVVYGLNSAVSWQMAEEIVHSVNCHHELLDTLIAIDNAIADGEVVLPSKIFNQLRQAIAKAEEK